MRGRKVGVSLARNLLAQSAPKPIVAPVTLLITRATRPRSEKRASVPSPQKRKCEEQLASNTTTKLQRVELQQLTVVERQAQKRLEEATVASAKRLQRPTRIKPLLKLKARARKLAAPASETCGR